VYNDMGEHSIALSYFEVTLNILQRSLPPNHASINNVRLSIEILRKKL
jgi:hypothetical protein